MDDRSRMELIYERQDKVMQRLDELFELFEEQNKKIEKRVDQIAQREGMLSNQISQLMQREYISQQAIESLNDAFGELNALKRKIRSIEDQEGHQDTFNHTNTVVVAAFRNLCDSVAKAFTKMTGHHCYFCIKIVTAGLTTTSPLNKIELRTYCRDKRSRRQRTPESYDNQAIFAADNSDFSSIIEKVRNGEMQEAFFFNNNLPKRFLKDYKNTRISKKLYEQVYTNPAKASKERKKMVKKLWNLPYRAAVVLPILPLEQESDSPLPIPGFIGLDCDAVKVFEKEREIEILRGLADTLYNYMYLISTR